MTSTPTVFVSYSHDSDEHGRWVRVLAERLLQGGVKVILDQWDLDPGQDLPGFMEQSVAGSDRVLLVCTPNYGAKVDARAGGAGYEGAIVSSEILSNFDTKKFVPLLRAGSQDESVPLMVRSRLYIGFADDSKFEQAFEKLLRDLHEAPAHPKPPLGQNPFLQTSAPSALAGTPARPLPLDDSWFAERRSEASNLLDMNHAGAATMEVCFGLDEPLGPVDRKTLLSAAHKAQINTFGWPIGLVLNLDHARPAPHTDGIRCLADLGKMDTFDYWYLRTNGDFYTRLTLFEDRRDPAAIYFNTRIVRATEALMYANRLYQLLGVGTGAEFHLSIALAGFAGRELRSSNPQRHVMPGHKSAVNEWSATTTLAVPLSYDELPGVIEALLRDFLELFDFYRLGTSAYRQLVEGYTQGRVS